MKSRQEIADLYAIVFVERRPRFDELVVDVRLVAALQVFDDIPAIDQRDLRMHAADSLIGNDEIAVLSLAAKHRGRLIEWQPLTRRSTFEHKKRSHEIPSARS